MSRSRTNVQVMSAYAFGRVDADFIDAADGGNRVLERQTRLR